jgi:hypothetical protein
MPADMKTIPALVRLGDLDKRTELESAWGFIAIIGLFYTGNEGHILTDFWDFAPSKKFSKSQEGVRYN